MKKILNLLFIFALAFIMSACSSSARKVEVVVDWTDFIKWNDELYEKSQQTVPKDLIGGEIGSVLESAPSNIPNYVPKNGTAGYLEIGTDIFYIKDHDTASYIAAFVKGDYVLYKTRESADIYFEKPSEPLNPENIDEPQAQAYFRLFQYLIEQDSALNRGIKYIAVDLSESLMENPDDFILLMEDFCAESGYILLQDTIEALREKGYVKDLYFEDGIVIKYKDIDLTDDWLYTDAMKWRSGLAAIGAKFSIKKTNGIWEVADPMEFWIS